MLSSDGGFLETTVTGMTDLSNGSLIMGDASNIQTEISAGNNLDVLTMGATTPGWVAPVASSAKFVLVGVATLASPATTLTLTISPAINCADIAYLHIVAAGEWSPTQNVFIQINGLTDTNYNIFGMSATGTLTDRTNVDKGMDLVNNNLSSTSTSPFFATADIQGNPVTQSVEFNCQSSANGGMSVIGGTYDGTGTPVTSFSEIRLDTSTVNMAIGTNIVCYKVLNA